MSAVNLIVDFLYDISVWATSKIPNEDRTIATASGEDCAVVFLERCNFDASRVTVEVSDVHQSRFRHVPELSGVITRR